MAAAATNFAPQNPIEVPMAKHSGPTPKSEASQSNAYEEARTGGEPTQDQAGPAPDPGTGGENPPRVDSLSVDFDNACDCIARNVKKFTDAGMGGKDAGELALRVWQHHSRLR